jgi:TolB-like protein
MNPVQKCAIALIVLAGYLLAFQPATASADFTKTKIAVLDFQVQGGNDDNSDIGKIVAEWLVTALVKEGRFDVIERRLLAKVLEEQKIGVSGVVDADSASKLGKVLGAKVVITGSVLQFQNIIEVNARIIEVESSSIIAAESVQSTSEVRLEELVGQMTNKIIKDFPLEGYIVLRDNNTVRIDLGRQAGVKRGMRFIAYKEGNVIRQPKTGEVLDVETINVGEVEIVDAYQKTASGTVISETSPGAVAYGVLVRSAREGDLVPAGESPQEPEPVVQPKPEPVKKSKRERAPDRKTERKSFAPPPSF